MPTILANRFYSARPTFFRSAISLSSYFPKGTQYFYAYPGGESSDFINHVNPESEELIAARAFSCAGSQVSVIGFESTCEQTIDKSLFKTLGISQLRSDQLITLPRNINTQLKGTERNDAIKEALMANTISGRLVMAQPFMDPILESHYQISPRLISWLNDKNNISHYITDSMLPKKLASYGSSSDFIASCRSLPLPFVAKAALSSAGDGVHLCRSDEDIERAIEQFKNIDTSILVEEYVNAKKNYGIHFGIPHAENKPVDILGFNEQLTSSRGKFLGGIIRSTEVPEELRQVTDYLLERVLPGIRQMGWYGVGCFDVLTDEHNNPYFIDGNFRMTGMTAYHFLVKAHKTALPLISFNGSFTGNQEEFEKTIVPLAGLRQNRRFLQLIALNNHHNSWNFNAAMMLPLNMDISYAIEAVLSAGIKSDGLEQLAHTHQS